MDYIRNSKNRKLKTQILNFFSRLSFGTNRLWLSGKSIILCNIILFISLFFPWLSFKPLGWVEIYYWSFSFYLGGVWFGIVIANILILFFLLSHEKKEYLRWYVPFRLSDAQAIVFVAAMLMVACVHAIISSFAYARIASQEVMPALGLELATGSTILILTFSYFFSQSEKTRTTTLSYLEKKEKNHLDEYASILEVSENKPKDGLHDKNMTLPI